MMEDLYQDIILDHYKHPRHFRELHDDEVHAEGDNPNCGDHIRLHVEKNGQLKAVEFDGQGCAICMASASMMTEAVESSTADAARELAESFIAYMRSEQEWDDEDAELVALSGVRKFPLRVKCATLPWHTLLKAMDTVELD